MPEGCCVKSERKTIGILGSVKDISAALRVFDRVKQELPVLQLLLIMREPSAMRSAIEEVSSGTEISVLDLATFAFNSINTVHLLINVSPGIPPLIFEAALHRIPIVFTTSVYMPPVFVAGESAYSYPYENLDVLVNLIRQIFRDPEEGELFAEEAKRRTIEWCGERYLLHHIGGSPKPPSPISSSRTSLKKIAFALLPRRRLVSKGNLGRCEFALTFDDGPSPATTPIVLEILQQYAVKATFFLVGNRAEQFPELVQSIVSKGHEVGSHSHTHPYFSRVSIAQAAREVSTAQATLEGLTGVPCRLFRPPFGELRVQSLIPAWRRKQTVVSWSMDLRDYDASDSSIIYDRVAKQSFTNGDIILYHAMSQTSVAALPAVIEAASVGGRKGVRVSELL